MVVSIADSRETAIANITLVRLVIVVDAFMDFEVAELTEGLEAVGPLTLVDASYDNLVQPVLKFFVGLKLSVPEEDLVRIL